MIQCWGNNIEVLSEQLELLRITKEEVLEATTKIETIDVMLTTLVLVV